MNTKQNVNDKCLCDSPYYDKMCDKTISCSDPSEIYISDDFSTAYCDCSETKTCTKDKPCDTSNYCKNNGTIIYGENKDNTYKCNNSSCECKTNYEGKNCQCDKSQKSNLIPNICKGEQVVCQDNGSYTIENVKTCKDLYNLNGVSDYNSWLQKCSNDQGILKDICNSKGDFMHKISCNDNSNNNTISI